MNNILRNFVVFEGTDGSGTSTQLSLLEKQVAHTGLLPHGFCITCEPADNPVGALIRSALKKEITLSPETLARLFAADRGEHLYGSGGIAERCNRGELVVCDRYVLSSLVYQGLECGDELPYSLNSLFPVPELLVYFDVDAEISQNRLRQRPVREIYEHLEFQRRVRTKYLSLLEQCRGDGSRVEIIDASQSPEKVAAEVWRTIIKMPIFKTEN